MATDKEVSFTIKVKDAGSAALKQIEQAADRTKEKLFSFKDILKELTGVLAGFSVVELVKDMMDLGVAADKTFRQIASNLPTAHEGMAQLKEDIEALANASGRGLEGMEQSAAAIAKMGVSSAEELKQQLEAATMLADATGMGVDESAALLIQLRREFHLTGEAAMETAAKLAAAGRGKVDLSELFSAFQASAPIFQKFKIDVDTGTRAIIALVSNGMGMRQVRTVLHGLDGEGIRQLAAQATIASDAMEQLKKRTDDVREGTARANQALKNEFSSSLEDLGLKVLPKVNTALRGTIALLELMKAGNWGAVSAGFFGKQADLDALTAPKTLGGLQITHTAPTLESQGLGPQKKPFTLPMSQEEKKKIEEAARKLRELRLEFDSLAATSEQGKLKSEAFTEAVNKYAEKARAAKLPAAELNAELTRLHAVAAQIHRDELEKAKEFAIGIDSALGALTGNLAQAASVAITERAAKLENEITLNKLLTEEEKKRLRATVGQTRDIDQALNAAKPAQERTKDTLASVGLPGHSPGGDITALNDEQLQLLAHQRAIVKAGGDDKEIRSQLLEIDRKRAEILKGLGEVSKVIFDTDREHTRDVQEQARAIEEAVAGAIRLGQALHVVSDHSAQTLHSILGVATGIGPLLDQIHILKEDRPDEHGNPRATAGSVIAAARPVIDGLINITGQQNTSGGRAIGGAVSGAASGAELGANFGPHGAAIGAVVGGLTGLVSGLAGARKAAEEAARAMQMIKDQTAATLADWRAQITGTMADQKAAALLDLRVKYDNILQTIEQTEAGKKMEEQRNKDLADAKSLYEKNKAALEANTTAILQSANIINNVNGYKLNLQLFNFSPAYGPTGAPTGNTGSGSSGAAGTGTGSSGAGGSPEGGTGGGHGGDLTMNVVIDGKVLATSVVRQFRKVSQASYGTTDRVADAMATL
jgi:hypothetical protein